MNEYSDMYYTFSAHQQPTIPENAFMTFIEINFKNPSENTTKFCSSFQTA